MLSAATYPTYQELHCKVLGGNLCFCCLVCVIFPVTHGLNDSLGSHVCVCTGENHTVEGADHRTQRRSLHSPENLTATYL
eukprot:6356352-Amphidinium_carterae.1